MDIPYNNKVGTKRYMAPELLNETIDEAMFDSWKMADVYSLGLVYWELARRCSYRGDGSEHRAMLYISHIVLICRLEADYQMPYHDAVTSDPSIEQMKEVVCDKKVRPHLPEEWETFEV